MSRNLTPFFFIIIALFICNACQMKLNGNLVCVDDAYYDRSTNNGSEGAPTLRIRKIHISKDESGNESIVLTYNNNCNESLRVIDKSTTSNSIWYTLQDKKTLSFSKQDNAVVYTANSYAQIENYVIASVSNIIQEEENSLLSFNDIIAYKSHGEAKGNVKYISNRIYCKKELFGEDSLIYRGCHNSQYDRHRNLIYEYAEDNAYYNSNRSDYGLLFSRSLSYDKNNRLVSERRNDNKGTTVIEYSRADNENEVVSYYDYSRSSSPIAIRKNKYTIDHKLKETEFLKYWGYTQTYHLDKKIIYKQHSYEDCIYGIVYDHEGVEKRKDKYDKNFSPIQGIIEFGEYSEYFDPFNIYKEDYSSQAIRDFNIKHDNNNITVVLKYPWREFGDPVYRRFVADDETIYDGIGNPIKRIITTYDETEHYNTSVDVYYILYKYDSQGNWIERHSILTSHKRNGKEEPAPWKGFIEYREIEYFEDSADPNLLLYKDLLDYDEHIATLKNKAWTIRIDLMKNGSYRYTSWKKKNINTEPNIVIYTDNNAMIQPLGADRRLTFINNDFSYEVTWADYNPNYESESHRWELIVKQSEKTVLTLSNE